jgi:hypothetical protein
MPLLRTIPLLPLLPLHSCLLIFICREASVTAQNIFLPLHPLVCNEFANRLAWRICPGKRLVPLRCLAPAHAGSVARWKSTNHFQPVRNIYPANCFHISFLLSFTLKMEAIYPYNELPDFEWTARCYMPEYKYWTVQSHSSLTCIFVVFLSQSPKTQVLVPRVNDFINLPNPSGPTRPWDFLSL